MLHDLEPCINIEATKLQAKNQKKSDIFGLIVGYEMIIANSARIYHLVFNVSSWNNCWLSPSVCGYNQLKKCLGKT